ncbi:hypothetical protein NQ317_000361 [Molorchus minor]|uniref:Uncharacterized protein n=1 Tax=Molorchus minor TaxID=1323400 RepID=A0ABQ9JN70_9CUCU|nr:hypothetical protein NQ317_000361 [Molorchus minor]
MGPSTRLGQDYPTCRVCGEEDEISLHVLCYCNVLAAETHRYLEEPFPEPQKLSRAPISSVLDFIESTGLITEQSDSDLEMENCTPPVLREAVASARSDLLPEKKIKATLCEGIH